MSKQSSLRMFGGQIPNTQDKLSTQYDARKPVLHGNTISIAILHKPGATRQWHTAKVGIVQLEIKKRWDVQNG
jgi:hypothetical protein